MPAANKPTSSMMTCPGSPFGEHERPVQEDREDDSAVFEGSAFDIPRTMSSVT